MGTRENRIGTTWRSQKEGSEDHLIEKGVEDEKRKMVVERVETGK